MTLTELVEWLETLEAAHDLDDTRGNEHCRAISLKYRAAAAACRFAATEHTEACDQSLCRDANCPACQAMEKLNDALEACG